MTTNFELARQLFHEGTSALDRREIGPAISALERALELLPERESILNNLSAAYLLKGDWARARDLARTVLELCPDSNEGSINLIASLNMAADFGAAIAVAKDLCNRNPGLHQAWNLRAIALEKSGVLDEARDCYETSIRLCPFYAEAHQNLALLDLFEQNFDAAWWRYEWRWKNPSYERNRLFSEPDAPWDFAAPLVIWNEHGLGDQIIYCSYLPRLLEKICVPIRLVSSPKLKPLFKKRFDGANLSVETFEEFTGRDDAISHYPLPMASLANFLWSYFRSPTTPAGGAYLESLKDVATEGVDRQTSPSADGLRVGVSWRSFNPQFEDQKSVNVIDLLQILSGSLPETTRFMNLQYGDVFADLSLPSDLARKFDPTEATDKTNDLLGVVRLISRCNLVVTVSNTTAHLAGALGVPCLVMVRGGMSRFWYWHDTSQKSPWYSSVELVEIAKCPQTPLAELGDRARKALEL
jgi:tetratricopeptide (TPR) repeat protein